MKEKIVATINVKNSYLETPADRKARLERDKGCYARVIPDKKKAAKKNACRKKDWRRNI